MRTTRNLNVAAVLCSQNDCVMPGHLHAASAPKHLDHVRRVVVCNLPNWPMSVRSSQAATLWFCAQTRSTSSKVELFPPVQTEWHSSDCSTKECGPMPISILHVVPSDMFILRPGSRRPSLQYSNNVFMRRSRRRKFVTELLESCSTEPHEPLVRMTPIL